MRIVLIFGASFLFAGAFASVLHNPPSTVDRDDTTDISARSGATSGFVPTPVRNEVSGLEHQGRWTNAERFQRGLPPLPPGRRFAATRVRRQEPSPTTYHGSVQALDSNGSPAGYISATGYGNAIYQLQSANDANVLRLRFIAGPTTGTLVNIIAENSALTNSANAPYFAPATQTGQENLTPGTARAARIVGLNNPTNPGAKSAAQSGTWSPGTRGETAVWSVNVATGALSMQWVQPDGSIASAQFFTSNGAIFYGDPVAYKTANPSFTVNKITLKVLVAS